MIYQIEIVSWLTIVGNATTEISNAFRFSAVFFRSLCIKKQLQFTNENSTNIEYWMYNNAVFFLHFLSISLELFFWIAYFVRLLFPRQYDMFICLHFHIFIILHCVLFGVFFSSFSSSFGTLCEMYLQSHFNIGLLGFASDKINMIVSLFFIYFQNWQ